MTTVGYGDTYPITHLGRLVVAISAIYGGVILSFTFLTMQNLLNLNSNEKVVLNEILIKSAATQAITSALYYNNSKHKNLEKRYNA